MDLSFFRKTRCRFLDRSTGLPVPGVVASLSVDFGNGTNSAQLPLATLCADATGYVSFDLKPFIDLGLNASGILISAPGFGLENYDLLRSLAAPDNGSTNCDEKAGASQQSPIRYPMTTNAGLTNAAKKEPPCIVFPIYLDKRLEDEPGSEIAPCGPTRLPSIQSPDVCDYKVSPFSFVAPSTLKLGDDCCENLLPSSLPIQQYRFNKVVVRRAEPVAGTAAPIANTSQDREVDVSTTLSLVSRATGITFGEVLEYQQDWYSLGHSLGEIKYSLPLAPGESTQLAVIEWSRDDLASRTDQIRATEFLDHDSRRDRAIEETVGAALKEEQGGNSFMGSTAGTASGQTYDSGMWTGNHAVGYGISYSYGNRDVEGESLQDLHDRVRQASSSVRSLNSTVIMQASQTENNTLQTRRVANHNHCHALTIQYYEVLRHYRMSTKFSGRRPAVLVPFALLKFDWEIALRFRTVLEQTLLDPSLRSCFEALIRLKVAPSVYDAPLPLKPGGATDTTPIPDVEEQMPLKLSEGEGKSLAVKNLKKGDTIKITASGLLAMSGSGGQGSAGVSPNGLPEVGRGNYPYLAEPTDLRHFSLIYKIGYTGSWRQGSEGFEVSAVKDGDITIIFGVNTLPNGFGNFGGIGVDHWTIAYKYPSREPNPTPKDSSKDDALKTKDLPFRKSDDELCSARLLTHLQANQGFYNSAVWMLMNAVERRLYLEEALHDRQEILYGMEDKPLAISGNYVAFQFNAESDQAPGSQLPLSPVSNSIHAEVGEVVEHIVTLPTRGLFAEAQMGHCNSCEQRDVTRMWDWTEMTAETPPDISGISPGPKGAAPSIAQGQLPSNVIQITQPQAAPDPTGLANALAVLKTPDVFRDMAGLDEVSKLLGELAKDATDANTKAMATQAQVKIAEIQANAKKKADEGGNSGSTNNGRSSASESDAAKQVDRLKAIEYAQDKGLLDDQGAQDATKSVLGGEEIASAGDSLPADVVASKALFPPNATDYKKIQKILALFGDARLTSASNINQVFASLGTNVSSYLQWLRSRANHLGLTGSSEYYKWVKQDVAGHSKQFNFRFFDRSERGFEILWDGISDIYGPTRESINIIEFLALDLASHVEGYGDYAIVSEAMEEGYGLDYFFEPNWVSPKKITIKKASYNTLQANKTAGSLFVNPDYQAAHNKLLPTTNTDWKLTDVHWQGADYFATQAPTSISLDETAFIRQSDFYKFRGRGYIQTTNRANYGALARLLRTNLDKLPSPHWSLVESWGPENASVVKLDAALTKSRDSDWSNLFEMTGGVVARLGVRAFNESHSNCLEMALSTDALDKTGQGTVDFLGDKINGYGSVLAVAVRAVLIEMYDSLA